MENINCLLTPFDLSPKVTDGEHLSVFKLAVFGTCVAEHLVNAGLSNALPIEHFLMETWIDAPVQDIRISDYDGLVFHLALRQILEMVDGKGVGDVSYINYPAHEFSLRASEVIKNRIDFLINNFAHEKPLFFLSFIEPPQTTKGFFHNNRSDSIYRIVRNINDFLSDYLSSMHNVYFVEVNDILSYYGLGESADSYFQHFTHGGTFGHDQSEKFYLSLLQRINNALQTLSLDSPIKMIITDLDNTLWKGVAAEEEDIIPWVHIEGWPIGYIEALLECKRRGILLAICSKNDELSTIENFRKICDNKIHLEDFFTIKINWKPKSENIKEILAEANILPDHVVFIDDNPLEIEEVTRVFPTIRTLSVPQQRWRNVLLHSPQTQNTVLSAEGQNKTELLKAKIVRDKISSSMDRDTFLTSLDLRIKFTNICHSNDAYFARALELLNKTNQFNTTGKRWTESELTQFFLQDGAKICAANVQDRLANHGLTAVAIVSDKTIFQVVLSCRVFGLGIETALLHRLMKSILSDRGDSVTAYLNDTGRNASCRNFYLDHGFKLQETNDSGTQKWLGNDLPAEPSWIQIRGDE